MAFYLGRSVEELNELTYDEIEGWFEFFRRFPYGWRDDNRAAIIAMSFGGSDKLKPEDLFHSLKTMKSSSKDTKSSTSQKFYDRFKHKFTEKGVFND